MGNQLISFRLRDEEVALLMRLASPEENASLTAQRLIRQLLGTTEIPPDALSTLVNQVNEFQEQVESVKGCVNEAINEGLQAVDNVVNEAVNQQMKAELFQTRSRFDDLQQRIDKYFQIHRESCKSSISRTPQLGRPTKPLNHSELAQRLINPRTGHPYSQSAITRYKDRADFPKWSEQRDPQKVAWAYQPNDGLFYPLESY
jgi:BMFP domain-containing protein YqiC